MYVIVFIVIILILNHCGVTILARTKLKCCNFVKRRCLCMRDFKVTVTRMWAALKHVVQKENKQVFVAVGIF